MRRGPGSMKELAENTTIIYEGAMRYSSIWQFGRRLDWVEYVSISHV